MKLQELETAPELLLSAPTVLYRVQRLRSRTGYKGIAYRSAQQYAADCYALFGAGPLESLRLVSRSRLVHPVSGKLHRAVADAVRGSQVPLVP